MTSDFYVIVLNPNKDILAVFPTLEKATSYVTSSKGLHPSAYRLQIIPKEGI